MTAKSVTSILSKETGSVACELAEDGRQVVFDYAERLAATCLHPLKVALSYVFVGVLGVAFLLVFALIFSAYAILCVALTTYRSIKNDMGDSDEQDPLAHLLGEIATLVNGPENPKVLSEVNPPAQAPTPAFALVPAFVENLAEPIIATQHSTIALQAVANERPAIVKEDEAESRVKLINKAIELLSEDEKPSQETPISPVLSEVQTKEISPVTVATKKSKKAAKVRESATKKQQKTAAKPEVKQAPVSGRESDIEQALQQIKDGASINQAARDCGVAASTLRGRLKKLQQQQAANA